MKGNRYNRCHGENPAADELLGMLKLTRKDFGRFRDVYLTNGGSDIVVFTRTGGDFADYYKALHKKLALHPAGIKQFNDDFDHTYRYIIFSVPREARQRAIELAGLQGPMQTVHQKFEALEAEMNTMDRRQLETDPRFAEDVKLAKSMATGGPIVRTFDDDLPERFQI